MALGNAWFRIELDQARGLVRIVRTGEALPREGDAMRRVFVELAEPLAQFAGQKVLLDLRDGPRGGRSDDEFEAQARQAQQTLDRTFRRVAVLVRSAVGKLQVRRLSGGSRSVFQDEAEALKYLAAS